MFEKTLSVIIFAGLVCVVSLSAIPYGSVEPWWTALFEAAVFLLAALLIARACLIIRRAFTSEEPTAASWFVGNSLEY